MTKEEKLLIAVCNSYFNDTPFTVEGDINYREFFDIAKNHNLIGIVHCVFNKNKSTPIDEAVRKLFEDRFFDLVYIYEMQGRALDKLRQAFSECGIKYVLFKGAVLRDMYSVPESRSMGDIDVLINSKDIERVKKALCDNGFVLSSYNTCVYNFEINDVLFEIHTRLVDDPSDLTYENVFENSIFNGNEGVLDYSTHLAYLITHTAVHIKSAGAGIRFVLDLAYMIKSTPADFEKVFSLLEKEGLTKFGKALISVCFEWFGVGKGYIEDTERLREHLVKNGAFGNSKSGTQRTVARLIQLNALDNEGDSPFKLKLKLAFPPYSALRKAQYINFLDGRAYLLPVAWVYRFAYNLKHSKNSMMKNIKNTNDEKINALAEEELEFFEEMGLI